MDDLTQKCGEEFMRWFNDTKFENVEFEELWKKYQEWNERIY